MIVVSGFTEPRDNRPGLSLNLRRPDEFAVIKKTRAADAALVGV